MVLIILILIIILFWLFYTLLQKTPCSLEYVKNDNLHILSKNELFNILLNDNDNYYKKFSELDLKVRNVNSVDEYKQKISNIYYECNSIEYSRILYAINKVDNVLKKYNIIGFDGNKASNIIWKIGVINNNIYEYGLPHTRGDVIIISKNILNKPTLESIFLHEKIHVYQKIYNDDIHKYLIDNNFVKLKIKTSNIRANPDIDEYIYTNKNNEEMMCIYNNNPSSILDVSYYPNNNIINEHPFEYMAYTIESELKNRL